MGLKINNATYGLLCQQPDQMLPYAVAGFYQTVTQLTEVLQDNIYCYRRTDAGDVSLPILNIYIKASEKTGDIGQIRGTIRHEITMPAKILNRDFITEASQSLYNALSFFTMSPNFLPYIWQYVPALREWDWKNNYNAELLYQDKQIENYITTLDVTYMVDLAAFYNYLAENGLNIYDPCTQGALVTLWNLTVEPNPQE